MSGLSLSINNKIPQQTIFYIGCSATGRPPGKKRDMLKAVVLFQEWGVRSLRAGCMKRIPYGSADNNAALKKLLLRNPVAAHIFLHFEKAMRVTPSLPQRGKQPKGSIPLNPPSPSLPSLKRISRQPSLRRYRIFFRLPLRWGQRQRLPQPEKSVRTIFQWFHQCQKNPITGTRRSAWFCGQRFSSPLFSSKDRPAAWGERP